MRGVSVVVCCHNSSSRLAATITHLKQQSVSPEIPWEVIVVDNVSTDGTEDFAVNCWADTGPAPLRVIKEPQLGLSHARKRGFSEAKYEFITFVDDDNWVCPRWVQLVSEIMSTHPSVGACGGLSEAVCEIEPPYWFSFFEKKYAVGAQGEDAGDISESPGSLWGAGLSVRKSAWQQLETAGFRPLLPDRHGTILSAGGDSELCFALRLAGWRLWYDPRLTLKHFLPASRLNWGYLRRLHRGFGASYVWLDRYKVALQGEPNSPLQRLRQSTAWKVMAIIKTLLRAKAKLLVSSDHVGEGSSEVLRIESCLGQLAELARARGSLTLTLKEGR